MDFHWSLRFITLFGAYFGAPRETRFMPNHPFNARAMAGRKYACVSKIRNVCKLYEISLAQQEVNIPNSRLRLSSTVI